MTRKPNRSQSSTPKSADEIGSLKDLITDPEIPLSDPYIDDSAAREPDEFSEVGDDPSEAIGADLLELTKSKDSIVSFMTGLHKVTIEVADTWTSHCTRYYERSTLRETIRQAADAKREAFRLAKEAKAKLEAAKQGVKGSA